MRINCLEPSIYNKIAAGEVVERPASIVKELVENSIDAKSTQITIEVENGGITKLRVTDNGSGIDYDDLKKAFLPHATSKITTADDLAAIKTLGFRGEALASIGAVSKVKLTSKTSDSEVGGMIAVNGGEFEEPVQTGCSNGTDCLVEDLFFNVPARAKFLKKPKTEESEITNLVSRFILANPNIAIKYIADGKQKYSSNGLGMKDALYVVYGKEAVEKSVYFEKDYGYLKIYGYLGKPEFSKPNKTYETLVINNRYVFNSTIQSAVFNAYGGFLMKKQFPFYCIYVDLDYEFVDVNVHPNKMEVRFANNSDIYLKTFEAVNRKINGLDFAVNVHIKDEDGGNIVSAPTYSYNTTEGKAPVKITEQDRTEIENKINSTAPMVTIEEQEKPSATAENNSAAAEPYSYTSSYIDSVSNEDKELVKQRRAMFSALSVLHSGEDEFKSGVSVGSKLLNAMNEKVEKTGAVKQISAVDLIEDDSAKKNYFADHNYKVVGKLFSTYLLLEKQKNLILIDQHAAHERILFDKLMAQLDKSAVYTQELVVPYILNVNASEEDYLNTHIDDLAALGFTIEFFGSNSFKVSSIPVSLNDINLKDFFAKVMSDCKNETKITAKTELRHKLATMACKAAVKGGDNLSDSEIDKLIESLDKNETQLLCPHGRPIIIKITQEQIEKWFKRIV